jgi:hypothetical protein
LNSGASAATASAWLVKVLVMCISRLLMGEF